MSTGILSERDYLEQNELQNVPFKFNEEYKLIDFNYKQVTLDWNKDVLSFG